MPDMNDVHAFRLRRLHHTAHLRRLQRSAEEHANLEVVPLWTNEEVARPAREHDRLVRRVDALIAESDRCLAQPLPRLLQVLREISRESRFRRRPAVVRLAFLDPLLAVVALAAGHTRLYRRPPTRSGRRFSGNQRDTNVAG